MDCDREDFFFFFVKNDGWKPAARFITYEFEQLVCLLFYSSWMEITFNKSMASVTANSLLFLSLLGRAKLMQTSLEIVGCHQNKIIQIFILVSLIWQIFFIFYGSLLCPINRCDKELWNRYSCIFSQSKKRSFLPLFTSSRSQEYQKWILCLFPLWITFS